MKAPIFRRRTCDGRRSRIASAPNAPLPLPPPIERLAGALGAGGVSAGGAVTGGAPVAAIEAVGRTGTGFAGAAPTLPVKRDRSAAALLTSNTMQTRPTQRPWIATGINRSDSVKEGFEVFGAPVTVISADMDIARAGSRARIVSLNAAPAVEGAFGARGSVPRGAWATGSKGRTYHILRRASRTGHDKASRRSSFWFRLFGVVV